MEACRMTSSPRRCARRRASRVSGRTRNGHRRAPEGRASRRDDRRGVNDAPRQVRARRPRHWRVAARRGARGLHCAADDYFDSIGAPSACPDLRQSAQATSTCRGPHPARASRAALCSGCAILTPIQSHSRDGERSGLFCGGSKQREEENVMQRPPRDRKDALFKRAGACSVPCAGATVLVMRPR